MGQTQNPQPEHDLQPSTSWPPRGEPPKGRHHSRSDLVKPTRTPFQNRLSVVGLATLFFSIVLLSVIGQIEFKAADWVPQLSTPSPLPIVDAHLVVIILAVGVLALTSTHINVNRFSLNGMYRNRLARAFLGAAREK